MNKAKMNEKKTSVELKEKSEKEGRESCVKKCENVYVTIPP